MPNPQYSSLQILIPIFNDWQSIRRLLPLINNQLDTVQVDTDVLLVDDGSVQPAPSTWDVSGRDNSGSRIKTIRILRLQRNLGHQRAICIGLCHLNKESSCSKILIMDGDGEDDPADVPRLIRALNERDAVVVFAERTRRSEGLIFTFFYAIYRWLHWALVGHRVRVGNFSIMNRDCLQSLCTASELWNHYAASVFVTRQAMSFVSTNRAVRLAGKSTMNFSALVMHGLSALSVFSDRIAVRLMLVSALAVILTVVGMVAVMMVRFSTDTAIPGWATNILGILTILLVQVATFMLTFCFMVLFMRAFGPFVPSRDYHHFVRQVDEVWCDSAC